MWRLLHKIITTKTLTESVSGLRRREGDPEIEIIGKRIHDALGRLYKGRSLRIRHVDAGSTNAEEQELTALGNAFYDIERFGLNFVASPKHADVLTVSGPVTRNLEQALKVAYEMMPEPRFVIALGDGACTGGIWNGSYAVVGPVEKVIPVDLKITGDPPTPGAMLLGLLTAIEQSTR